MRTKGFITGTAVIMMGIAACNNDGERGTDENVTPDETRILSDSSQAETFSGNETREQVINGFLDIPWTQESGDIRQTAKTQLQQQGFTITKEESKGNATKYTVQGGAFKNYPVQNGWIVAENGVGIQEAILILKPKGASLDEDFQNLVQSLSAQYGKTHESNANAANWAFAGDNPALVDLIKNTGDNTIRVQARRSLGGTTPYSWDHVSPGDE